MWVLGTVYTWYGVRVNHPFSSHHGTKDGVRSWVLERVEGVKHLLGFWGR